MAASVADTLPETLAKRSGALLFLSNPVHCPRLVINGQFGAEALTMPVEENHRNWAF